EGQGEDRDEGVDHVLRRVREQPLAAPVAGIGSGHARCLRGGGHATIVASLPSGRVRAGTVAREESPMTIQDSRADRREAVLPDRNLALELVRVTEAAALVAGRWVGLGDKNAADGAAVAAMRGVISRVAMDGVVVIGEGEK